MNYKFFNLIICATLFQLISFNLNAIASREQRKRQAKEAITEEQYCKYKIWRRAFKQRWGISKKEKNIIDIRAAVCMLQNHKTLKFSNRKHITNYAHPSIQARGTGIE